MARIAFDEVENYNSANRGSYFSLKNDKDSARVRILYKDINDITGYAVYRVKVGDKERYVNSLRAYNDPIDKDPFAMAGYKVVAKMFIPVYNIDADEVQIWERGKAYFNRVASLANRYNPLYNEVIEIERNGKAGDMKTEYQFYPVESSEFDISSVEIPDPLGTIILDKTFEEMEYYVQHGDFPDSGSQVAEARSDHYQSQNDASIGRRTPGEGRRAF